jgi:hypothetical protein
MVRALWPETAAAAAPRSGRDLRALRTDDAMMNALVASRDSDFLTVSFRRTSPHFAASVPVSSLSEEHTARYGGYDMFDVLRELADCASASRF